MKKHSLTKQKEVTEDKPTRATYHHGSTTQAGSNYGQGSNDIGRRDANRQGSESNSGSNCGNEKKNWNNEALRRKDITQNRQNPQQR